MKTLKRTAGRPMDPFGNDIFDIIDHYFTSRAAFEKGQEDERKRVHEIVNPVYKDVKREHKADRRRVETHEWVIKNLDQKIAQKENELKEVMKKKTPEAAKEAAKLREDKVNLEKRKMEELELLEKSKVALKKSTARKAKMEEAIDQMMWALLDKRGEVLVRGPSLEDVMRTAIAKVEEGSSESWRVFTTLKQLAAETSPTKPYKTSATGILLYSISPDDFIKKLDEIQPRAGKNIPPEKLKRNKLAGLLTKPGAEKFVRRPKKK